jgi:hypothetical protein
LIAATTATTLQYVVGGAPEPVMWDIDGRGDGRARQRQTGEALAPPGSSRRGGDPLALGP